MVDLSMVFCMSTRPGISQETHHRCHPPVGHHVTPLVSSLRRKITGATEYFSRESLNWMTVRKTSKGQLVFPVDGPLRNPTS